MKILLINNIFYRKGGSEAVLFNTAELLTKAGNEVRFFSIENPLNCSTEQKAYFAPLLSGVKRALAYFYNPYAAEILDRVLDEWHPDIAHIHLIWGGLSPSIIKILHKHSVPVVHTAHDYRMVCPAYTFRNGKGQICEKCKNHYFHCILGKCSKGSLPQSIMMALEMRYRNLFHNPAAMLDGIIYVSQFSKRIHESHNNRLASVYNTVLYNFSKKLNGSESDDFFLYSGRLSAEKGCRTMIKAFLDNPELKLVVAGFGPIEAELKELAKDSDNIIFRGHLNKDELFDLVEKCRFVVVPSEWYENNPMSIIEAYAAEKPVIGARIGGIPEIVVDGKTGLLFESGDDADLSRVLSKCKSLSDSEYSYMRDAIELIFLQRFNYESYIKKLVDFYNFAINKGMFENDRK